MRAAWLAAGLCLTLGAGGCTTNALDGVSPKTAAASKTAGKGTDAVTPATGSQTATAQTKSGAAAGQSSSAKTAQRSAAKSATAHKPQGATRKTAPHPESGTATKNAAFVDKGVARSDTYPNFVAPKAATTQMTDAEKKAFEARMAVRLKAGAKPSQTQAEYAERLKLMRALAAENGSDTQKAIEK